ncbi:MAG: tetratricopeptide repeat protein [Planctomycetaceae bacterium]|nr:tetratricopeptide repeat protein [Planctomycetales bacterium]MCB9925233.1 tetratricopeptide repeat protein [Planctomycetaceae bacterium]
MVESIHASRVRKLHYGKKFVFAILVTAGFFLLFEFGLGLCGIRAVTSSRDPFVGFSQLPLLEPVQGANGEQLLTTAENKLVWFNSQTFPAHKPAGTRRIFCVGGSTTYGRPYWDATSYSGWLRELLPFADNSCEWEVINAGGVSYASYRVAAVMKELAQYEPDLFIVYSVHNEFLERRTYAGMFEQSSTRLHISAMLSRTRTWAFLERVLAPPPPNSPQGESQPFSEEVDELLNHTVGPSDYHRDEEWRADVLKHYARNLNNMVEIARNANAEVVFVTPASNEKDCSPFKSEAPPTLSETQTKQLQQLVDRAREQLDAGNFEAAIATSKRAVAIDASFAAAHFWMGKALFAAGRTDDACAAFDQALELDVCPLRALSDITTAIQQVAERERIPIVDFAANLRSMCKQEFGHECLGDEYFLDHVHPTIEVHKQLALWIIETLQRAHIITGTLPSDEEIRAAARVIDARVDKNAQGTSLRNLAKVLHWAGKFDEAGRRAADALQLIDGDLESQFLLAECLRQTGRNAESMIQFERLFELEPNYSRGYIPFGMLLAQGGHLVAAKTYLAMGVYLYPQRDDALQTLGSVHLQLEEYELAEQALSEANSLNPIEPSTLSLLARAKVASGDLEAAVTLYEHVLELSPDDANIHNELGKAFLELGRQEAAKAQFLAAIAVDPNHEDAHFHLEGIQQPLDGNRR